MIKPHFLLPCHQFINGWNQGCQNSRKCYPRSHSRILRIFENYPQKILGNILPSFSLSKFENFRESPSKNSRIYFALILILEIREFSRITHEPSKILDVLEFPQGCPQGYPGAIPPHCNLIQSFKTLQIFSYCPRPRQFQKLVLSLISVMFTLQTFLCSLSVGLIVQYVLNVVGREYGRICNAAHL